MAFIQSTPSEFDPLDYDSLALSCVSQLMGQSPVNLGQIAPFSGAGVYAIFYTGTHQPFLPYSSLDSQTPIYVGKAIPRGGRKGRASVAQAGQPLYGRLTEHASSIIQATNLDVNDFDCRFLVMKPVWISLAEHFLINQYRPVWNICIDGFGNHDPGAGRHRGEISWWDTLHPGRPWATRLRQTRTQQDALQRLQNC